MAKKSENKQIFISYAKEEQLIGKFIERYIKKLFSELIDVFLYDNISLGEEFHKKITKAINASKVIIVIVSPDSINKIWLHYEVGYARGKEKTLIPACIMGMKFENLPFYLMEKQACNLMKREGMVKLFNNILEVTGGKIHPGMVNYDDLFAELSDEIQKLQDIKYLQDSAVDVTIRDERILLSPYPEMTDILKDYPDDYCGQWRQIVIDGAAEIYNCMSETKRYFGFYRNQIDCQQHDDIEWPHDFLFSNREGTISDLRSILVGSGDVKGWIEEHGSQPNRIRLLTKIPFGPTTDRKNILIHFGNSDYFTMNTINELSKRSRLPNQNIKHISNIFPSRWGEPGKVFPLNSIPHHISAQGVIVCTDPYTKNKYLILGKKRADTETPVYGWGATMAEQMQAPDPFPDFEKWWLEAVKRRGIKFKPPEHRDGDYHIQETLIRGLREEYGLEPGLHYYKDPPLLNVCLEQDMYFITFIFYVDANLSLSQFQDRYNQAPHNEEVFIAAYQIGGKDKEGNKINGPQVAAKLLTNEKFDGSKYLIKDDDSGPKYGPWHISSRMRIYVTAFHLWGTKILEYVKIG